MSTPKPFYITNINSNLIHRIHGAELFSIPGPVLDLRFCSYARNPIDLYKDAHDFLVEQARRELEQEAAPLELDEVDLVALNDLCRVSFSRLEKITDPDEIGVLSRAIRQMQDLDEYKRDQEAWQTARKIQALLRRHLTGQSKDLADLRQYNAIAEIQLHSLHTREA